MPDMQVITLVNRTSSPITFMADGVTHTLQPGDNPGCFRWQAYYAKKQNPLMGSEDFHTLAFTSLVGVKGEDECDPIDDDALLRAMESVERFDRRLSGLPEAEQFRNRYATRGRGSSSQATQNAFALGRG